MDELQASHRKQLKELQSRITQKKKQATKKTRKGVNDECDALERELKDKQAAEVLALSNPEGNAEPQKDQDDIQDLEDTLEDLAVNADSQKETTTDSTSSTSNTNDPATIAQEAAATTTTTGAQEEAGSKKKKPNRARERLARRQAEQEALFAQAEREASDLPNLKNAERARMLTEFRKRNLKEKEIRADGHCLYSAVADQLQEMDIPLQVGEKSGSGVRIPFLQKKEGNETGDGADPPFRQVRKAAAEYISTHSDDFEPFLEEPLQEYVTKIRDTGEWGGQLELMALAKTYGVGISVLQGDGRVEDIEGIDGVAKEKDQRIWLAYYRHGFGLGEHYNSLHKTD